MKKLLLTLGVTLTLNTSALMAELTQTQLNAVLSIVTNFILDDGIINHNGTTYKTVTSPYTGRVWLDRNLGASQVCTSFDDVACYGDYYQWGRAHDGHQVSSSAVIYNSVYDVSNVGHGSFIHNTDDWASVDSNGSLRAANWSVSDGTSVCPSGFRVPTYSELQAETLDSNVSNRDTAFSNFLKLPSASLRNTSGTVDSINSEGVLWSSSVDGTKTRTLKFTSSTATGNTDNRGKGISIRCIKDTTPADIVPPVITITGDATQNVLLNDSYSDAGATAIDDIDGNLAVTSVGTVDTSTLGGYTITYTATDNAGNVARAVRTVSVVDNSITHNSVTYGEITSPYTGRVWLDRNLGASQVCTSFDDVACYGDYYQWGRAHDGHQESNSSTTTILVTDLNNMGGDFVIYADDWTAIDSNGSLRAANWSVSDGTSVCPSGFRVPTYSEFQAETLDSNVSNRDTAFSNFLKLPSAGLRNTNGVIFDLLKGILWSSSVDGTKTRNLRFTSSTATGNTDNRGKGISIRCIKDTTPADIVPPVITITGGAIQSVLPNESYSDAGATATDDIDGSLAVTSEGTVDTSTLGEYTITYTATDSAGNVARAVRTVIVLNNNITHNSVTYKEVASPYTGRVWLDRNLGASQACTSFDDVACYGDYYQWGRAYDGHQVSSSTNTPTLANDVSSVGHGDFITSADDWTAIDSNGSLRAANWSVSDGTSICPSGFRVPTLSELQAETVDNNVTNRDTAFSNFLKLPSTGLRAKASGAMIFENNRGALWSSSVDGADARIIYFDGSSAGHNTISHANGRSVRCIKNTTPTDIVPPVITITGGATQNVLLNESYNDAGATAIDDIDGNLAVTSVGTVDTSTLGGYTITYTATDSAGNVARAVRTVSVSNSVIHNSVTYGEITSPYTGRVWLDRNLGASQVCTSFDDALCYGDYYQWGRAYDGHQVSSSVSTSTLANDVSSVGHGNFISNIDDWASVDSNGSLRAANWSVSDGTSVCPSGFRVPTYSELQAETLDSNVSNRDTAFSNFLKLPSAGYRYNASSDMITEGTLGALWSSSVDGTKTRNLRFTSSDATDNPLNARGYGRSIRCIKDTTPADIVPPVITITGGATQNVLLNESYSDAGATAIDDIDGNLAVTSVGTVDTSILGYNIITYTATDSAGNVARAVKIVSVVDNGITHNSVTYGKITSPYTGRVWLDRNLGASQVCTSFDDVACYGDYYQWGRAYDGHQVSSSADIPTLANDVSSVGHGDFITSADDWASVDSNGSLRAADWSVSDGTSVCPSGFRVPTYSELQAETLDSNVSNSSTAFSNFLKLPSAGLRDKTLGNMIYEGVRGALWSSSVDGTKTRTLKFTDSSALNNTIKRANGRSVRCIKDTTSADIVPPVITITGGTIQSVLLNESYLDAGVTATDDTDGNLAVTSVGTVDTSILGDYNITYIAIDSAGNVARAVRTVSVLNSVTHNGVNYGEITSPYTGRVWLDRNLGASRVCMWFDDAACYGDYYQWGRNADGHQDPTSTTTNAQAGNVNIVGDTSFITSSVLFGHDWAKNASDFDGSARTANWSKTNGTSVCPIGFRVPTIDELNAELFDTGSEEITNRNDAFYSFLHLPSTGRRFNESGSFYNQGSWGNLWSSSAVATQVNSNYLAHSIYFYNNDAVASTSSRADGFPVRCIKN